MYIAIQARLTGLKSYIQSNDHFDPAKEAKNRDKHHISLARWEDLTVMAITRDDRFDYGEPRYRAYGYLDGLAYRLVFTIRDGAKRPISLRRAHAKEMKRYVP